ncbi:MAG: hypothetical protein OEV44_04780 [Spirochaetota bacterium]|nr:hypothetical protein [Spirochaetota bacterium]
MKNKKIIMFMIFTISILGFIGYSFSQSIIIPTMVKKNIGTQWSRKDYYDWSDKVFINKIEVPSSDTGVDFLGYKENQLYRVYSAGEIDNKVNNINTRINSIDTKIKEISTTKKEIIESINKLKLEDKHVNDLKFAIKNELKEELKKELKQEIIKEIEEEYVLTKK